MQTHEYGALGITDFTHVKSPVTIAGEPLKHMLFHYRMPASGWALSRSSMAVKALRRSLMDYKMRYTPPGSTGKSVPTA